MNKAILIALGTVALASCGSAADDGNKADAVPETLPAGLYDLTTEIVSVASTDNSTPATKLKQGDKLAAKACVKADGIDPAAFGEAGDSCTTSQSYMRTGKINVQLTCKRKGDNGQIMPSFQGDYTKDGFSGDLTIMSYLIGNGDYRVNGKVTAKRTGDCPATSAKA